MVSESYPWKQDLLRRKSSLIKYNTFEQFEKNNDAAYTAIEKGIFYSAFIIRKLIDCVGYLSAEADNYKIRVRTCKPLGQIDIMHRFPRNESYDLEEEIDVIVNGRDICNWLIHSYVFFIAQDSIAPASYFCVASDRCKNKNLYIVSMNDWIKYIEFIEKDYVSEINMHYDEKKKDYIFTRKTRESQIKNEV